MANIHLVANDKITQIPISREAAFRSQTIKAAFAPYAQRPQNLSNIFQTQFNVPDLEFFVTIMSMTPFTYATFKEFFEPKKWSIQNFMDLRAIAEEYVVDDLINILDRIIIEMLNKRHPQISANLLIDENPQLIAKLLTEKYPGSSSLWLVIFAYSNPPIDTSVLIYTTKQEAINAADEEIRNIIDNYGADNPELISEYHRFHQLGEFSEEDRAIMVQEYQRQSDGNYRIFLGQNIEPMAIPRPG